MASLLDYVGTDSRVGKRNNIWTGFHLFFYNAGEGAFGELSPGRVTFSGNIAFMGRTEHFYLQVELLNNTRCNVIFQGASRNIPYRIQDGIFSAKSSDVLFYMTRYNNTQTHVRIAAHTAEGKTTHNTYHIQPV